MLMLVPEAWQNDSLMPQEKKDFYMMVSCMVSFKLMHSVLHFVC